MNNTKKFIAGIMLGVASLMYISASFEDYGIFLIGFVFYSVSAFALLSCKFGRNKFFDALNGKLERFTLLPVAFVCTHLVSLYMFLDTWGDFADIMAGLAAIAYGVFIGLAMLLSRTKGKVFALIAMICAGVYSLFALISGYNVSLGFAASADFVAALMLFLHFKALPAAAVQSYTGYVQPQSYALPANGYAQPVYTPANEYSQVFTPNYMDLEDDGEQTTVLAHNHAVPAQPVQPASSMLSDDTTAALMRFKQLLDAGIITQEEFDAKKKQLLGL